VAPEADIGGTKMAKWHRKRARDLRAIWLYVLGNKCAHVGKGKCKGKLEFDCIIPMGHDHHRRMDTLQRMNFYVKQAKNDNLQLLCKLHNSRKSRKDAKYHKVNGSKRKEKDVANNEPF
jgi:hypothetical protein